MHHKIHLPHTNMRIHSLHKSSIGNGIGTVLLDGGIGGQSSYRSIDDYIATTGVNPYTRKESIKEHQGTGMNKSFQSGTGLADKIADKLSKLKIEAKGKPKRKNIVMSV